MNKSAPTDFPDAYNAAVAKILDARKHELRKTFDQLEVDSGVNSRTLKRLLSGERPIRMGQFIAIVAALDLSPSYVVVEAEKAVSTPAAKSRP